jgi:hypothetical protein
MGKTTPTTNDVLREAERAMNQFKKVLQPLERNSLQALFVNARKHIAAISEANYLLPFESILLAMVLEQEKAAAARDQKIRGLEIALQEMKAQLAQYRKPLH